MNDPINHIEWREAASLQANYYNPNIVFNKELDLIALSIIEQGWIQPILINTNGVIIDGFHRWKLSQSNKTLLERYHGQVPCAVLSVSDSEAMLITIRMNRAKGSHVALYMAKVVKELVKNGMSKEQIVTGIGGTREEVDLLMQDDVFTAKNIKNYKYSKSWTPVETRNQK